MLGEPIWVRTLSSHCKGPFRCSSIQQGVLVTVCLLQDIGRGVGWETSKMARTHIISQNTFSCFGEGLLPRARERSVAPRSRSPASLLRLPGHTPPTRKRLE